MISRLPTYSFKRIRVPHRMVSVAMAGIAALAAAMITEPWVTLAAIVIVYAGTIPFAARSFERQQQAGPPPSAGDGNGAETPEP
jgi:CDP-diacylglycerol--serine O-phosphatidyltransferase